MRKKIFYILVSLISAGLLLYGGSKFLWVNMLTSWGVYDWVQGMLLSIFYMGIILIAMAIGTLTIVIKEIFKN